MDSLFTGKPGPFLEVGDETTEKPVDDRPEGVSGARHRDQQPPTVVLREQEPEQHHFGLKRQDRRREKGSCEQPEILGQVFHGEIASSISAALSKRAAFAITVTKDRPWGVTMMGHAGGRVTD